MRLHRRGPVLAALATLASVGTPTALAQDAIAPSGGLPQTGSAVVAHHPSGSSDGWLIDVGVAGGVALVGVGFAGSQRTSRRVAASRRARAASES
jgi:hypothetical protein